MRARDERHGETEHDGILVSVPYLPVRALAHQFSFAERVHHGLGPLGPDKQPNIFPAFGVFEEYRGGEEAGDEPAEVAGLEGAEDRGQVAVGAGQRHGVDRREQGRAAQLVHRAAQQR